MSKIKLNIDDMLLITYDRVTLLSCIIGKVYNNLVKALSSITNVARV